MPGPRPGRRTHKSQQLLDRAIGHHQAGQLSEAEQLYRRALGFMERTGEEATARETLLKIGLTHHLAFDYRAANEAFGEAAREYERTAYDYSAHDKSAAAGYAAIFAHRQNLKGAPEAPKL